MPDPSTSSHPSISPALPRRPADAEVHPHRILTFRDAAGFALQLVAEGAAGHSAVVVDGTGAVTDLTLFPDPMLHSPATALDRAYDLVIGRPAAPWSTTGIVLMSLEPDRPPVFTAADRRLYRLAIEAFGAGGALVADWLRTDGDGLCSAAFLWHPRTAWPNDPPSARLADLAMMGVGHGPGTGGWW